MKLWWMIRRLIVLSAMHAACCLHEWWTEVEAFDRELEIRRASDPAVKAAWAAVSKTKEPLPPVEADLE